nr:YoaK family protein [Rhabdothermincola salaria]
MSGPLGAAVALTAAAGFSDAHIFLHVTDVFVANMSGNLVLAGMALGEGSWRAGARHGTALVSFALGAAVANWFHARNRRRDRPMRPDLVLAFEAGLMVLVVVWIAVLGGEHAGETGFVYPVIGVGAFAMGMQNAALLRVGAVAVATTYASGSVARLGAESALMVSAPGVDERSPHARAARVLAAVVLAYLGGAALAAWAGSAAGWLLIPVVVLAATALATHRRLAEEPWDVDIRPPA